MRGKCKEEDCISTFYLLLLFFVFSFRLVIIITMATPDVDITPSESQLETDILENKESKKSNEGSLPNEKIKTSLNVLKTSCLCTSVAGVCTCIHLNGNFNNAKIKKVLTLIQEPTMCEAGPSTSSYSRIKRRKLPSSESSDERLSIIESKKVCKALDSDDLDSDDVSANEADVIDVSKVEVTDICDT